MSKLKLDEDILYKGIKKWEERRMDFGGGIPLEFYIEYRDLFICYKEQGETKESMMSFLLKLANKHPELEELIYEIADVVSGFIGNKDLRVW